MFNTSQVLWLLIPINIMFAGYFFGSYDGTIGKLIAILSILVFLITRLILDLTNEKDARYYQANLTVMYGANIVLFINIGISNLIKYASNRTNARSNNR